MAQDYKYLFFQAVTIFVLFSSIGLMIWGGMDIYKYEIVERKNKISLFSEISLNGDSVRLNSLTTSCLDEQVKAGKFKKDNSGIYTKKNSIGNEIPLTNEEKYQEVLKDMNPRVISHIARFLSSFTAGLFVLLWFFLYRENTSKNITEKQGIVTDYTLLFFALAMLVWGLPMHKVFQEGYEDTIAVLNTLFFLYAYWDIENKFPRILELKINKWSHEQTFTINRSTYYVIIFTFGVIAWMKYELLFPAFDIIVMSLLGLSFFISIFRRFGNYSNYRSFLWDRDTVIGMGLGLYSVVGFIFVILSYCFDKESDYRHVLVIFYQFLLLITTGVLALSWVYEKMIKEVVYREDKLKEERRKLEEKNLKLEEKENDLKMTNERLRETQTELETQNGSLEKNLRLLEIQKQEIRHYSRNILLQFEKEISSKRKNNPHDVFADYVMYGIANIREHYRESMVNQANTTISLNNRMKNMIDKFENIFGEIPKKAIRLSNNSFDSETSFKLIGILDELMLNAKKHGGGIESVGLIESENYIEIFVENKTASIPENFEKKLSTKSSSIISDDEGLGLNLIQWYILDIDKKALIESDDKTITIKFNKKNFIL